MTVKEIIKAHVDAAYTHAKEDEESPRRAALYFLLEDLMCGDDLPACEEDLIRAEEKIESAVLAMSDEECVKVCQKHGALL